MTPYRRKPIDWRIQVAFYVIGWALVILFGVSILSEAQGACRWIQDPYTGQWVQQCDPQPTPDAGGWYPFQEQGWPIKSLVHLSDGGTGTIIEMDGIPMVISCAHKDSRGNLFSVGDRCGFTLHDGRRFDTTVVDVMQFPNDVCIMRIDNFQGAVNYCTIAQQAPQAGDKVTLYGFPNGSFRGRNAVVNGYNDEGSLELTGGGTGGESGGPVINTRGEIVGILSCTPTNGPKARQVSWCCSPSAMQRICQRVRARLDQLFPHRPGRIIARATPRDQQPAGSPAQPVNPPLEQSTPPLEQTPSTTAGPVAEITEQPTPAPAQPSDGTADLTERLDVLDGKLDTLEENNATRAHIDGLAGAIESLKAILEAKASAASAWSMGKVVAGTLGLSSPIGLAIVLAARFGRRKIVERIIDDRGQGGPRQEPFHQQPSYSEQPSNSERFRHVPPVYPTN